MKENLKRVKLFKFTPHPKFTLKLAEFLRRISSLIIIYCCSWIPVHRNFVKDGVKFADSS